MHPLARGKDHGEGQSSQKEPHCVSDDGSWGRWSNMEYTTEEGRGQCVSGSYKTITNGAVSNQLVDSGRGGKCNVLGVRVDGGGGVQPTVKSKGVSTKYAIP
jgi:hypothetical protein